MNDNGSGTSRSLTYGIGLPFLGAAAAIAAWWLAVIVFDIRPFLLPAPPDIVKAFMDLPTYLLKQAWVTLWEVLAGFAIAVVAGLVIALLVTSSRILDRMAMPVMVGANSVPKLAVAPLLLIWMGFGQMPKIIMVVVICFFPILLSARAGLNSTPGDLGELARSLSASRWKAFVKVRLPWALPQVFVGLKVAVSLAVIGAVVAELTGATEGLGFVIVSSGQQASTALAFAAIVLLSIESIGLYYLIVGIERLLLPWMQEVSG